mgnify:CR=1 FL=1
MIEGWTDGAAWPNPGRGGYAAILREDGAEHIVTGSDPHTTNNRMEMLAVIVALEATPPGAVVRVYSDSQYVVNGRGWSVAWQRNGWRTRKGLVLNQDLWRRLLAACATREVTLVWVRGHAGNGMNERCDALANAAAQEEHGQRGTMTEAEACRLWDTFGS